MEISIQILGVKDGDAIILSLKKESKSLVMLIDSGEKSYSSMVINELETALTNLNKTAPDIIVCSHYDNDHINGMIDIINYFENKKTKIGCVWLHRPNNAMKGIIKEAKEYKARKINLKSNYSAYTLQQNYRFKNLLPQAEFIIEGIPELMSLVDIIDSAGIPIQEPFFNNFSDPNWPEIEVLGPTSEYFNKKFPDGITLENFIDDHLNSRSIEKVIYESSDNETPCFILDKQPPRKSLTAVNRISIVFCITIDKKKFLFPGDAGIESFKQIPDYKERLKDVYFLKIPHHASRNNLSSELISLMKPKHAYVSGDTYVDEEVIGCLKAHGSKVKITRIAGEHLSLP